MATMVRALLVARGFRPDRARRISTIHVEENRYMTGSVAKAKRDRRQLD
jgi:hypothetical protein